MNNGFLRLSGKNTRLNSQMLSSIPITISDSTVWDSICHISRFIISSHIQSKFHKVSQHRRNEGQFLFTDQFYFTSHTTIISSPLIFCQRHVKKWTGTKNEPSDTWHMNVQRMAPFFVNKLMPSHCVFNRILDNLLNERIKYRFNPIK